MALAAAISVATADESKTDKTAGERTREALDKAADKTKEGFEKAKEKTKEAGRAIVEGTKKATDAVVDAVTPDADAAKVEVNLQEHQINMPSKVSAGKTAFVVKNAGKDKHNFQIQGEGLDKKFLMNLGADETKVLHVDLKPGSYTASCPMKGHETDAKVTFTVE
jgi:hypothetical protein